ncbi:MAG TPA: lysylphosphatidylglycerol synthase domain-containing protein [Acidimicrobiales bacterium]|nr:lysylphosphatidylglycerol synthase domain-containing protein [Acidimicrobiales bacterium]
MKRRRLVQTVILVVGLVGIAFAVSRTVDSAQDEILPSAPAWVAGAVLAQVAIVASARAWVALFSDLLDDRASRAAMRGTFYLAQLTKYLPVGGVAQAASQLGLAPTVGVPIKRAAVAFPVSAVGAVAACGTLSIGLALDASLPAWARVLALCGLLTPVFLRRPLMARVLDLARRVVHRIPGSDQLPTQRDIVVFYGWALITIGSLSGAYAVLLGSLHTGANLGTVFSAFAFSWAIGFLAIPIPAGVGVREAVLVALLPGVGTAPLLAVSLALRLLTIGTELLAVMCNRYMARGYRLSPSHDVEAPQVTAS